MMEAMKKFEDAVNEVMDLCKGELGKMMFDEDIDDTSLRAMRMCFNLIDASMNLLKEQTKMMNEMNEKLDKLMLK